MGVDIVMKYMLIAGEASGDLHGASLIAALKEADMNAEMVYFGGEKMALAAGKKPEVHYSELNVMGFSAVLKKLPHIVKLGQKGVDIMKSFKPDALILIDFPGFNLRMAKAAHKLGIKVHYFISPKIWAWKEWRIKSIRRNVDYLYSILPFEQKFFRERHGYDVEYVGNPSVKEIDNNLRRLPALKYFCERNDLDFEKPIIALLPGSRKGEIINNMRIMIEACHRFGNFQYVVAAAPSISERFYRQNAQDPKLKLVFGNTTALLKHARAALVTSGTATLETALVGTPQVVCYRSNGSKLAYKIMQKMLKVKYVSLPNLIVSKEVVPELLLHYCTAEEAARKLGPLLLPSPDRDNQFAGYKIMRRKLGTQDAASVAARKIAERTMR